MSNSIIKISKVEIEGLWNRFDLTWDLHPDVNVLSGINGSGKSTILSCVAEGVQVNTNIHGKLKNLTKKVKIFFSNGKCNSFEKKNDTELTFSFEINALQIDIISTFDNEILEIGKRPDESVRTELDRDIFRLQKEYLDYQLNIGKKILAALSQNNDHSQKAVAAIRARQERFLEIIDSLFKETGKKINQEENEIVFVNEGEKITAYQLSSGEKQMLVILLTTLIQDNKPAIMFMDEPEISLHFDWQKKLIGFIRELNPNVQIILATHSPAVIMEGWHDKVFDVKDLITKDSLKAKK